MPLCLKMKATRCLILTVCSVSILQDVLASDPDSVISDVLSEFRQRIESLEARDVAKDAKIAAMESEISDLKIKMDEIQSKHMDKEASLQDKIVSLEKMLIQPTEDVKTDQQSEQTAKSPSRQSVSSPSRIKKHSSGFRADRAVPETEVAFYATHKDVLIHHLGANQVLLFQQVHTNVGNAYNNSSGAFVAPVAGTYVFHATVMAIDTTNTTYLRAHFDVDGISYSVFVVTYFDQSSQMLVINLQAGQTVTIKNDYMDTGFHGNHHSTFSGFLLYQNFPSGNIVGK